MVVTPTRSSVEVVDMPIGEIRIRFRLRTPKDSKIEELAASIKQLGLMNPITLDSANYLIAGYHRLSACKLLEYKTIPAIVKDTTAVYGELMEIDENLKRNELNHIEIAEHMVRREELLEALGVRMKQGSNQYSEGMVSTAQIAEEIGLSSRVYRLKRQPGTMDEEVRDMLRDTHWAENLMDMVKLSQQEPEMQFKIAGVLITGKYSTFKRALVETLLVEHNKTRKRVVDFDLKERWGIPSSIMRFKKADVDLQGLTNQVGKDPDVEWNKREGLNFGTNNLPVYQMMADHAEFLVTYYTREDALILDSFMGRGTIGIASLWHNRRFIGYDIDEKNVRRVQELIDNEMPEDKDRCRLYHSDGVALDELKDEAEYLDAVIQDPPYCLHAERYTDDPKDISTLVHEEYLSAIKTNCHQVARLLKTSNFDKKEFFPLIYKTGTARRSTRGIVDMDYDFQTIAKECGFVLWDKLYNTLASPMAALNWERNYNNRYVHKNYECNLVFVKF